MEKQVFTSHTQGKLSRDLENNFLDIALREQATNITIRHTKKSLPSKANTFQGDLPDSVELFKNYI